MQIRSLVAYMTLAFSNAVSFASKAFDKNYFYQSYKIPNEDYKSPRSGKTRNRRAKHKQGKSEEQLHAARYPSREFHPNISQVHRKFWEERGYVL